MDIAVRRLQITLWTLAALACAAAAFAEEPATKPASPSPSAPVVSDAQLDEALTAAEMEKSGPAFTQPLQSVAPRFREVLVSTEPGKGVWHKVTLNARGKKLDAVRFRVPPGEPRDLVWAFLPPETMTGWYILPVSGEMQGFTNFFRQNAKSTLGTKAPAGAKQILLQSLPAKNLKPGDEYVLWFRFKDEKPAPLHLAIGLLPAAADLEKQQGSAALKGLGITREGDTLGAVDLDAPTTQPLDR